MNRHGGCNFFFWTTCSCISVGRRCGQAKSPVPWEGTCLVRILRLFRDLRKFPKASHPVELMVYGVASSTSVVPERLSEAKCFASTSLATMRCSSEQISARISKFFFWRADLRYLRVSIPVLAAFKMPYHGGTAGQGVDAKVAVSCLIRPI